MVLHVTHLELGSKIFLLLCAALVVVYLSALVGMTLLWARCDRSRTWKVAGIVTNLLLTPVASALLYFGTDKQSKGKEA
jgi:hypothetical protein